VGGEDWTEEQRAETIEEFMQVLNETIRTVAEGIGA